MTARPSVRKAWLVWILIPAGLLLVVAANAHLVYVAFQSHPGCVAHVKEPGQSGGYLVAQSAC